LAEILAGGLHCPMINEPLQINDSKKLKSMGIGWNQPPPPDGLDWPEGEKLFRRIFQLRFINLNKFSEKNTSELKEFVVKNVAVLRFIRLNLLVSWVVNQFNIPKPIYIIRNPYAVVASQLNHPAWSAYNLNVKTKWFQEYFDAYQPQINEANSKVKKLALEWCMQNKDLLEGKLKGKVHVVHFEDLILNPKICLEEMQNVWGISLPPSVYEELNKPSGSTPGNEKFETKEDKLHHLSKWKNSLSEEEISDITQVLENNNYPAKKILQGNMFTTANEV
jgi:hypothetical protein